MEKELINKIVEFLKDNEVDFVVPGSYNLPTNIVIKSLVEFLENGKSDLITKHKHWNWYSWDLNYMKNGDMTRFLSLEKLLELKELKKFWNDDEDLEYLNEWILIETKRSEIRKTYKFKRKEGFTTYLKKKCKERDNYKCVRCRSKENLEIDHIKELIDGGENTLDNLQTLCRKCHKIKTNKERKNRI